MRITRPRVAAFTLCALAVSSFALTWAQAVQDGFSAAWGPNYSYNEAPRTLAALQEALPPQGMDERIRHWNRIAIDASGLDHTPLSLGETRVFGEQLGPGRASRAMAIVHIAIFEVVNAFAGTYRSYIGLPRAPQGTSVDAAIAQTSHDTLVAMFPSQRPALRAQLNADLAVIPNGDSKTRGIVFGHVAAVGILARRANDGSRQADPRMGIEYIPDDEPGVWRQDPISLIPIALGANWGKVRPFVMRSPSQFRVPPPPAMTSAAYTAAFNEVKRLGGDDDVTSTERTPDQTFAGIYWAYDGTPSLCAPPRLYNQLTMTIADLKGTRGVSLARLLALVNVAMADAGVAIWESKFFYDFWRPVTGIREADAGTGPTGLGDGNPNTLGDPTFTPLGAPASNLSGPDFTPPFPAYPSGHAGFGGALFEILRRFYGTDRIRFTFVSDEFNGETRDNDGMIRPLLPRTFSSLSQAEEENGQSRIYLGIHWSFDKTQGIAQGRRVARYVYDNAFQRR